MKICIINNTLLSGGAEKQSLYLSKVLSDVHEVWQVVYYGGKIEEKNLAKLKEQNTNVVLLKGNHLSKFNQMIKLIRNNKIQVMFSYLLTTNLIGGLAGKLTKCKTIGGIRSSVLNKNKILMQKLSHNFLNVYTVYNSISAMMNMKSLRFYEHKMIYIPNYIEVGTADIKRNESKEIKILTVGRFDYSKDFSTAIKSIVNLRKKRNNFKYTIIGYGKLEKKIREEIKYYNASEYINIIINPDNISDYYKCSDIYISTSINEGLSNTILEAMSYSLPIVITDVGDGNQLSDNGNNGFICKPGDIKNITNAIDKLCDSYMLRIKYGKSGYNYVKENYSIDKFKLKYLLLIDQIK